MPSGDSGPILPGQFPWHISIIKAIFPINFTHSTHQNVHCAGAIFSGKYGVTAAHCVPTGPEDLLNPSTSAGKDGYWAIAGNFLLKQIKQAVKQPEEFVRQLTHSTTVVV